MIRIGLVGHGYWGPNLLRNFMEVPEAQVVAVSDLCQDRLERARARYPNVKTTTNYSEIVGNPDIDAVAIATPISTHFQLALAALKAGKHVLVEKPLTSKADDALRLIEEAERKKLILMVGHTFVYSGAVQKIKELVADNYLGNLYYYDSVRANLGMFREDVNVIWDLAVHDLSIMESVLPLKPIAVMAIGLNHVPGHLENMAYLTLHYAQSFMAHVHVNWLAPVKLRLTLIGGSDRMIVYDDVEPSEKVKIYESGVVLNEDPDEIRVGYRTGDMMAPKLSRIEPLRVEVSHFLDCVRSGAKPTTGWEAGLRVVRLLEAASTSLQRRGRPVELEPM